MIHADGSVILHFNCINLKSGQTIWFYNSYCRHALYNLHFRSLFDMRWDMGEQVIIKKIRRIDSNHILHV